MMRKRTLGAACIAALCLGGGVAGYAALSSGGTGEEIIAAAGAASGRAPAVLLSGYSVTPVSTENGDIVVIENADQPDETMGVGCAPLRAGQVVAICAGIRMDGKPAITIGRTAVGVSAVRVEYATGAIRVVVARSGLFLALGPAPAARTHGEPPVRAVALGEAGVELGRADWQ